MVAGARLWSRLVVVVAVIVAVSLPQVIRWQAYLDPAGPGRRSGLYLRSRPLTVVAVHVGDRARHRGDKHNAAYAAGLLAEKEGITRIGIVACQKAIKIMPPASFICGMRFAQ